MKTAFGLDLSGYAGGNSGFARADLQDDSSIRVTVYEGHVFGKSLKGLDPLGCVVEDERRVLKACCETGDVLVDTPVDLQGLPSPSDAYFAWELTKRPVDYAFDALAPLANLIGSPVARFQNILAAVREERNGGCLGEVYETYPAATLKLLGLWSSGYGARPVRFTEGRWEGGPLADIANSLRMGAEEGVVLDGDEFDAATCAITGVVGRGEQLAGNGLSEEVFRRIQSRVAAQHHERVSAAVPRDYVLMQAPPDTEIRVLRKRVMPTSGCIVAQSLKLFGGCFTLMRFSLAIRNGK